MPTAEAFRHELVRMMADAQQSGSKCIEINAGALHRRLGGYPGADSQMPTCCQVMKAELAPDSGDVILNEPRSGQGATLTIRYRLPRRNEEQGERIDSNVKRTRKFKLRLWRSG